MALLKTATLMLAVAGANAGASDIGAAISIGGGNKFGSSLSAEHVFAEDLTMGCTVKNNCIQDVTAKFHENFADITIKMTPKDNGVTGDIDMKNGDSRVVANFDKAFKGFITKVALTSDKLKFGPMYATLKPTYDAKTKLFDFDVVTDVKAAKVTMHMSQVEKSPHAISVDYKLDNGVFLKTCTRSDASFDVACEADVDGHAVSGTMTMKKAEEMPELRFKWGTKHKVEKVKLDTTVDASLTDVTLEAKAKMGDFGTWTSSVNAPYSEPKKAKWALSTKFDI